MWDFVTYGACWIAGFAHHDGRLARTRPVVVAGVAAVLGAAALYWLAGHPGEDGYDLNEVAESQALWSLAVVLLVLRWQPPMAWLARIRPLDAAVTLLNNRAVTVYLWHNIAIVAVWPVLTVVALDDLGGWGHPVELVTALILIGGTILAFGWAEDLAARRRPATLADQHEAARRPPGRRRRGAGADAAGLRAAARHRAAGTGGPCRDRRRGSRWSSRLPRGANRSARRPRGAARSPGRATTRERMILAIDGESIANLSEWVSPDIRRAPAEVSRRRDVPGVPGRIAALRAAPGRRHRDHAAAAHPPAGRHPGVRPRHLRHARRAHAGGRRGPAARRRAGRGLPVRRGPHRARAGRLRHRRGAGHPDGHHRRRGHRARRAAVRHRRSGPLVAGIAPSAPSRSCCCRACGWCRTRCGPRRPGRPCRDRHRRRGRAVPQRCSPPGWAGRSPTATCRIWPASCTAGRRSAGWGTAPT